MRGPSAVVFRQNEVFRVQGFPSSAGPVDVVYTSRWIKSGPNVTVPGHLWVEVRGKGKSLEESLVPFANAGFALLPTLSLSANAAIGGPELDVAFDSTPGISERDYFQSYVAPESGVLHTARLINVNATTALLNAIARHGDGERLRRAANQYRLALDSWRLGRETLSLAHLWMGLEALAKAKIRAECEARGGSSERDLADSLGVESKHLQAAVRKDLLLAGDGECYAKAKDASDGLEHGFLGYDKIHELSKDVRHRMAGYVRTAILTLCGLQSEAVEVLTKDPFDKPLGHWPLAKYLRGRLLGTNPELAAKGNAYPFMRWKTVIKECGVGEDGKLHMKFNEELTAELGEGISFEGGSWEVWEPG
jgi:hypothetical protein